MPSASGILNYGTLGIAWEDVTAQLMYTPVTEKGKTWIYQTWQVNLAPNGTDDWWSIRLDASTNEVVSMNNFTNHEHHPEHNHGQENFVELNAINTADASFSRDGFLQQVAPEEDAPDAVNIVGNARYFVIPYPYESPNHGQAANEINPWNRAGQFNSNAVSLKWHNDGTNDYTCLLYTSPSPRD